jgi:uncharacterized protein YndB with AHSA1/START domain
MKVVTESISVKAPVERVFEAYVNHIDEWWPRYGKERRYSFAPKDVDPKHIRFEPEEGGRFYETFANGEEYVIGSITEYAPPHKFSYTWKSPDWPAATLIEVTFVQTGEQTVLSLRHSGFEALDMPEMAIGYQDGTTEIFGFLKAWLDEYLAS